MKMKSLCLMFAVAINAVAVAAIPSGEQQAKRQARSVHLVYDAPNGDKAAEVMGTVVVTQTQTNSYYMALGWDCGYCGIQDKGAGGNILIFSVWDLSDPYDFTARQENAKAEDRAKLIYSAPNVNVARFGGEGTGIRTLTNIGWRVGEPVTIRLACADTNDNMTSYTCFYKMGDSKEWSKIAEVSTIKRGNRARGFTGLHSFVEDFWRNGYSATVTRRAEFSNIMYRMKGEDDWKAVKRAMFSADGNASMAIDAGRLPSGAMFLQTGGATTNVTTKLWKELK